MHRIAVPLQTGTLAAPSTLPVPFVQDQHIDHLGISLRFEEREVYVECDEPDQYVHRFSGEVLWMDDRDEDQTIGWFDAAYVDVESAIDEGDDIPTVFDAAGQNELEYFEALYEMTGDVRPDVLDQLYGKHGGLWAPNLLILERLAILPAHRGKRVGLVALWGLMRILGLGAGIVVMKPFPLQHERMPTSERGKERRTALHLDEQPKNLRKSTAALRRYYKRLGFKTLRGTEFMIRDARRSLPSIASLLHSK